MEIMIEETFKIYINKINVLLIIENTHFVITDKPKNYRYEGCFNTDTHDFKGGELFEIDELVADMEGNFLLKGVTFSGGDPMEQPEEFAYMAEQIKKLGLNIWSYTGYVFEDILKDEKKKQLLEKIDVLVDGKFEINKKEEGLKFKGSSNQRIIDVKESLKTGEVVILKC
ncbi:MAG: anaerobic ribonucleoside-triphosphate reductase activating protein [Sarcina sp.]